MSAARVSVSTGSSRTPEARSRLSVPHPRQLKLEVGHVRVEDPEVMTHRARRLGQRLLDLAAPRALGVDVLLGASQPTLALCDHAPQPVRLCDVADR
jgi:hypothetical protein